MDLWIKCIIVLSSPILLCIAQISYRSLLSVVVLGNPFALSILITGLNFATTRSKDSVDNEKLSSSSNNRLNITRQVSSCCSYESDKVILYFKIWIISTHLTFLFSFQYFAVPSLTVTISELGLLYGSYSLLLILILNLKSQVYRVTEELTSPSQSDSAMPLTKKSHSTVPKCNVNISNGVSSSTTGSSSKRSCDQLCYLMMLAYPIIRRDKNLDWINGNGSRQLSDSSFRLNGQFKFDDHSNDDEKYPEDKLDASMVFIRKMMHYDLRSSKHPISIRNNYLLLCNILHLVILAQIFYLNVTYTCACNTSKLFGRSLLIPMECSDIYDRVDARSSMFVSVYSGQLFFCHLVFLFKSSIF